MDKVWNRKEKRLVENIGYQNRAMIFVHKNLFARFIMSRVAILPLFSTCMSMLDYTRFSRSKVLNFVNFNNLDESEFEKPASAYSSFSEFFDRKLKPEARPVCRNEEALVSPADGALSVYPDIPNRQSFAIKGQTFTLVSLLRDKRLAEEFAGGSVGVVYLSPTDYHRYHYPCDCELKGIWTLGNRLFSVNPVAIESGFRPFDVNIRDVSLLNNKKLGNFLMVEVGALYVGRMVKTNCGPGPKYKGDEKGYFGLGGSTIVLLFRKGSVKFDEDIIDMSKNSIPSRVRMGEKIARIL